MNLMKVNYAVKNVMNTEKSIAKKHGDRYNEEQRKRYEEDEEYRKKKQEQIQIKKYNCCL